MTQYINCLREEHKDENASAILNDSGTYISGSVRCMGCGKWYMKDNPSVSFNSYKELLSFVNAGPTNIRNLKEGEILPIPKMKTPKSYYKKSMSKSRKNFYGLTMKSYLKSDRTITNQDGSTIYVDKIPKVAPDFEGSHETVKEFFIGDTKEGRPEMQKGFFNRIVVDSDDTGSILPRLNKLASLSGTQGFWVILNESNNKFQASINLTHTVIAGHDLTKVKEVSRCLNVLVGDEHMTGSFMKNHAYKDSKETAGKETVKGAQRTRTLGFDTSLQEDFENHLLGDSFNWENKWMNYVRTGRIELQFINSTTGEVTDEKDMDAVVFICTPQVEHFNIRKDKTWSTPIEKLWANTALRYAQVKRESGVRHEEIEYSKKSRSHALMFALSTSILKDNHKSDIKGVLSKHFLVKTEKFSEYYTNSMRCYNEQIFCKDLQEDPKILGLDFVRRLMSNDEDLKTFVILVRAANQNGFVSILQEDGLFENWDKIYSNKLMSQHRLVMKCMTKEEIELIRLLMPLFVKIVSSKYYSLVRGKKISSIHKSIRPLVSIANETAYYSAYNLIRHYNSESMRALEILSKLDDTLHIHVASRYLFEILIEREVKEGSELGENFKKSYEKVEEFYVMLHKKNGIKFKTKYYNETTPYTAKLIEEDYNSMISSYKSNRSIAVKYTGKIMNRSSIAVSAMKRINNSNAIKEILNKSRDNPRSLILDRISSKSSDKNIRGS